MLFRAFLCFISISCSLQAMQLSDYDEFQKHLDDSYEEQNQQRIVNDAFDKNISAPQLSNVYKNICELQQKSPAILEAVKTRTEASELMIRVGSLPLDMCRNILCQHAVGQDNTLLWQKINADPYGRAVFKLHRALEAHKKLEYASVYPLHALYDAPPVIHNLCYKLHEEWKNKRTPKVSLHEELIIQKYMPNAIVKKCPFWVVACQRPHRDRTYVTSALKKGLSWGSQAPFYGFSATCAARFTTLFVPSTEPTVENFIDVCNAIAKKQPDIIRYLAGIPLIATLPFIHGFASALSPSDDFLSEDNTRAIVYSVCSLPSLFMTLVFYGCTGSPSHGDFQFATTHSLTAVPLAVAGGVATSLYRSATEHPIEKRLSDIKRIANE